jgi:serine/threonine-protein phosphatase 6 regulatory ankyrin repeat subunit A/serine/threonine-protein phosphatase 6 regulatory ankyrin repeat subunit B
MEAPLWLAAKKGHLEKVTHLISLDPNEIEQCGGYNNCSPLAIATVHNKTAVVLKLIECGADLLSKDRYFMETPLHCAVRKYNARQDTTNIASILIKAMELNKITLDTIDECGRTALHLAVADRNDSIVVELLESGANVNVRDVSGATPLKCSIIDQTAGIAKILIQYGADVNERYNFGRTPLHLCTQYKDNIITSLLLGYGAEIEAKDFGGSSFKDLLHKMDFSME